MAELTYLPEAFRQACHSLSDRLSGPMGANKTPHDWERFFKMEHTSELTPMGDDAFAIVVYEDSTKQSILASNAQPKASVAAATTAALAAATLLNGVLTANANGVLPAQDGVTLLANQALLVKNQAAPAQNGVYVVTSVGAAGAPWILTRRNDQDSASGIVTGDAVAVDAGTANGGKAFSITTAGAITVDTTGITYAQLTDDNAQALFSTLATLLPNSGLALHDAA